MNPKRPRARRAQFGRPAGEVAGFLLSDGRLRAFQVALSPAHAPARLRLGKAFAGLLLSALALVPGEDWIVRALPMTAPVVSALGMGPGAALAASTPAARTRARRSRRHAGSTARHATAGRAATARKGHLGRRHHSLRRGRAGNGVNARAAFIDRRAVGRGAVRQELVDRHAHREPDQAHDRRRLPRLAARSREARHGRARRSRGLRQDAAARRRGAHHARPAAHVAPLLRQRGHARHRAQLGPRRPRSTSRA